MTMVKDIDTLGLINASELLITVSSMTGLEAMILDKPLITINLTDLPDTFPYAEYGASVSVSRPEDFTPAIEKCLNDNQVKKKLKIGRERFIRDYLHALDGKSTDRIISVVESLLERK